MNKSIFTALLLTLGSCSLTLNSAENPGASAVQVNNLKINQLQSLGSHNSYHERGNKRVLNFLKRVSFIFPKEYNPKELDYAHEPIDVQLNTYHLRSFEIDIYADPQGGQFYKRKKNNLLARPKASGIEALKQPGFKVFHIPDIDYNSHFLTFKSALQAFKTWSDAHPDHLPLFIMVESKQESIAEKIHRLHFTKAIPFTADICNDLDKEIRSVFGDDLSTIITPDKVRGEYPSLNEAVLAGNWPSVGEARGKIVFILMGPGKEGYLEGHPSLKGRAMFTFSRPGNPEAAFIKYDDASKHEVEIMDAVKKGYMVRTRADNPNVQNRSGDYSEMKKAFESGAQLVSTDYYRPDPRYKTRPRKFKNYFCSFPNGELERPDPVNGPATPPSGAITE